MMHALIIGRVIITNMNILLAQIEFSNEQMTIEHSVCRHSKIVYKQKNHYYR